MNPIFSLSILFHLLDLLRSSRVAWEYFTKVSAALFRWLHLLSYEQNG